MFTRNVCFLAVLALAGPSAAVSIPGFDHARPRESGEIEIGGGAAGGDDLMTIFGLARFGLLDDLDLTLRAGYVDGFGPADESGFDLEASGRFRFLREEDTRVVDIAAVGAASILNTANIFILGLDPQVLVSRHFEVDGKRQIYVSAGIGLAVSYIEVDGIDSDLETDLLGWGSAGVDVVEAVRLSLEARLRGDVERFGLAVTYTF